MSVRLKPTRHQIESAQGLYAQIEQARNSGKLTFRLHAGNIRPFGWRDGLGKLHRLTLSQRTGIGMVVALLFTLSPLCLLSGADIAVIAWSALCAGLISVAGFMSWFSSAVANPLGKADQLAGRVAGCNLDGKIEYDSTSPMGSLMRRMWLINLNMRAIVADVRSEVVGVNQAAQDLHRGSIELADRTDAQSQGLEKSAASIEEISGAVRETADTAQSLASMSSEASSVAAEGAGSINHVSESMHRIEASSNRIAEIVDVIEKLAFQTNLLALNAAVEAAHAGEDGRGFAVVAAEVRALAHRSSKAAQQIRELIQESTRQVSDGTVTVDAAARTIRKAVESVHLVTERLGEITLATREESKGVAQIGDAMQVLDEVTRQNANLVQESTRACEALNARADTLRRAVQIFSVDAG